MNNTTSSSVNSAYEKSMSSTEIVSSTSTADKVRNVGSRQSKTALIGRDKYSLPWDIDPLVLSIHSPSRHSYTQAEEEELRSETASFISAMGQKCRISQIAIATASVYMHVFFSRFSFARYDRYEVAATCLFLAGKVEEKRTRVDQVLTAFFEIKPMFSKPVNPLVAARFPTKAPAPDSPEFDLMRSRVYSLEYELLDAILFLFDVRHPYTNLMSFLRETIYGKYYANATEEFIKSETNDKGGLAQVAWLYINDSLRTTLCLRYHPDAICVGVIALSLKRRDLQPPRRSGLTPERVAKSPPWHIELFGVDEATIEDICNTITQNVEDEKNRQRIINVPASAPTQVQQSPAPKRAAPPVAEPKRVVPPAFTRSNIVNDALAPANGRHTNCNMITDSSNRIRNAPPIHNPSPLLSSSMVTHSPRGREHNQNKPPAPVRPTSPSSPPPIHPTSPVDSSSSRLLSSGSRKRPHSPEITSSNARSRSTSPKALEGTNDHRSYPSNAFPRGKHVDNTSEHKEGYNHHSRDSARMIVARDSILEKKMMNREPISRVYDMKTSQADADSDELEEGEIRIVEEKDEFLYRNSVSSNVH